LRSTNSIVYFLLFFFISTFVKSQEDNNSAGAAIGLGSFLGDFPTQTVIGGKIFFETGSPVSVFNRMQFNFTLAQKVEKILPGSYDYEHYSYFTSFGLSGIFTQQFNESIKISEGVGIIYLNDRSFDDINSWNYGILITLLGSTKISSQIDLLLNIDYGLTVNNTNVNYIILMLGIDYSWY